MLEGISVTAGGGGVSAVSAGVWECIESGPSSHRMYDCCCPT